jgi:hypothetical protein
LADICQEYNLNIPTILRGLTDKNIKAEAEMTIKKIAEENNISPVDVYGASKEATEGLSQSS